MSNIPITQVNPVRFRGPTDSAQHNKQQEDIFYDIMQLFQMTNDLEKALEIANKGQDLTNQFQSLYIRDLENDIIKLKETINELKEKTGKHSAYAFSEDIKKDSGALEGEQAYIDSTHHLVHLPVTGVETSKTYIYDEIAQRIVIPSALKVEALPAVSKGWLIEDEYPLRAVNGNNEEYWHRRMITDKNEASLNPPSCEFVVTLPDTIISNRDINTIYLHPFPLNGMTVNKIEYRLDGDWKLLPGWKTDNQGKPVSITRAGNLKFCFSPIPISQIKVTMTQPHWLEENTKKVYHFGIQELGIFYTDYESQVGKMEVLFPLEGPTETRLLTSLIPTFFNEEALSDKTQEKSSLFSYQIYMIDHNGQLQYTKDSFPILVNTNQILVKATIHSDPHSKTNPTLESLELTYEDV